jgi:hypothetical protein
LYTVPKHIDPTESFGGDADFALSGPEKGIFDYYNGDPEAGFLCEKKAMLSLISNQLKGQ